MLPENFLAAMLVIQLILNCIIIVGIKRLEWQTTHLIETLDLILSQCKESQDEAPPSDR